MNRYFDYRLGLSQLEEVEPSSETRINADKQKYLGKLSNGEGGIWVNYLAAILFDTVKNRSFNPSDRLVAKAVVDAKLGPSARAFAASLAEN